MTLQTAQAIEDQAAEWLARLDRYGYTPELRAQLEAWLEGDTRRRGALLQAQAALQLLNEHFTPPISEFFQPAEISSPRRFPRRLFIGAGTMAASVAAGLVFWSRSETYGTKLGEIRRIPLDDGSVVALNTQSKVSIDLKPDLRVVTLTDGEAWFQVAKDHTRPFLAEAGKVRVRAVGTAFAVRRRDNGADVMVTEGIVETWTDGAGDVPVRLSAGQSAFVSEKTAFAPPPLHDQHSADVDRALAWRSGQIDLAGESLSHAIAEFNRYNTRKIVLSDHSLEHEPLYGVFRTDDPNGFAEAVHGAFNVPVAISESGTIRIGRAAF